MQSPKKRDRQQQKHQRSTEKGNKNRQVEQDKSDKSGKSKISVCRRLAQEFIEPKAYFHALLVLISVPSR
eukprot:gene977-572_t